MALDFSCPVCSSDSTQRLYNVYNAGLSSIDTSSTSFGAGSSVGHHRAGFGTVHTQTQGTAQTVQSKNASPPEKLHYFIPLLLIFAGYLVLNALLGQFAVVHFIIVCLWVGASLAWVGYALQYNLGTWPARVEAWRKLFICGRCDHVFRVDPQE